VIREHLARVLESPAFRTSDRCKHFLRFVVEQSLQGRQHDLKERLIGSQVFSREPGYDTATDAIVRVKANEVRKRLAQYYGSPGSANGLQIELAAGSYVPEFRWIVSDPLPALTPSRRSTARVFVQRLASPPILAALCVLLLSTVLLKWHDSTSSELDQFWAPVIHIEAAPVIFVPASRTAVLWPEAWEQLHGIPPAVQERVPIPRYQIALLSNFHVTLPYLNTILNLYSLLERKGKPPQLRTGSELSLTDLQNHAVISLGAYQNPWTLEKSAGWRYIFHYERTASSVRDQAQPGREWKIPGTYPWVKQSVDYAIISRVFDPLTGNVFLALAGITGFGSQAAAEFLTNPLYWREFARSAPRGWQKKNLQIVLETVLVETTPNPPKVLAMHFW
jgi:hypothetical protein